MFTQFIEAEKKYIEREISRNKDTPTLVNKQPKPTQSIPKSNFDFVKKSLRPVTEIESTDVTTQDDINLYEKQLELETATLETAYERLKLKNDKLGDPSYQLEKSKIKESLSQWHDDFKPVLENLQNYCKYYNTPVNKDLSDKDREPIHFDQKILKKYQLESFYEKISGDFVPLFTTFSIETLVLVTINTVIGFYPLAEEYGGIPLSDLYRTLAYNLQTEHTSSLLKRSDVKKSFIENNVKLRNLMNKGHLSQRNVRNSQLRHTKAYFSGSLDDDLLADMPITDLGLLSDVLIHILIKVATYRLPNNKTIFVFSHSFKINANRKLGILAWDDSFTKYIRDNKKLVIFGAKYLPMIVQPRPWLNYIDGGYLTTKLPCMRFQDCYEQKLLLTKAGELGKLHDIFCALDALGSTKWTINSKVLQVIIKIRDSGKDFANLPPQESSFVIPPKPINLNTNTEKHKPNTEYETALLLWRKEVRKIKKKIANTHSLRCDINYKIEIANTFNNHIFYFPHNMDFRGRAYPIPPLFNHIGSDMCRGLLLFADKKPLGKNGLRWLKIGLANSYGNGVEKLSFNGRLKFIENNYENIKNSSCDPLNGNMWWMQAEEPFQCLSYCTEVHEAILSGRPECYMSSMPVHKDGTCNGLQHYAALGLDCEGAHKVNLTCSHLEADSNDSVPQDVYSGVLELVLKKLKAHASEGVKEAIILDGSVTRKVIKQTVMTNVYGVTFIGGKDQIQNKLNELDLVDPDTKETVEPSKLFKTSIFLTKLVFESLDQIFCNSQKIQKWFNYCARKIANSVKPENLVKFKAEMAEYNKKIKSGQNTTKPRLQKDTSVTWTTPLGLTIVQPYREDVFYKISSQFQVIKLLTKSTSSFTDQRKQIGAFPPNFIHSLDATHMMLTALEMKKRGLEFASVHDSYWTHANDVDQMYDVLKEKFIELYKQPILENLREEFTERYKDNIVYDEEETETLTSAHEKDIKDDKNKKPKRPKRTWKKVSFCCVPKKGEFNIEEVSKSIYFFH